jgi:hypothetical protein
MISILHAAYVQFRLADRRRRTACRRAGVIEIAKAANLDPMELMARVVGNAGS